LSFPSLPSCLEDGRRAYARMGGGVEGGGVQVIGLEPADEPGQLWDCSAPSSAMGKAMMASAWRCVRSCRSLAAAGVPGDGGGVGGQLEPPGSVRAVLDDCPAEALAGRGHPGVHAKGVRKRRPFGGSAPNCAIYLGATAPSLALVSTRERKQRREPRKLLLLVLSEVLTRPKIPAVNSPELSWGPVRGPDAVREGRRGASGPPGSRRCRSASLPP
jgi:hypothetical protein